MNKKIVIVSGPIANKPFNGGAAWTRLNYMLGLRKLNFEPYFIEHLDPATCVDEAGNPAAFQDSANLSYFRCAMRQFGLDANAALICGGEVEGMDYSRLCEIAGDAALLLNISGHLRSEPLKRRIRVKAYLDLDPGYTQYWHASGKSPSLEGHDFYFTIGENIGTKECSIPANGIPWRLTRHSVVLSDWGVSRDGDPDRFTTVASWRGPFGAIEAAGKTMGGKVRQFRKYIAVPSQCNARFEVALDIHPADRVDRELLCSNSWRVVDARTVVPNPLAFRQYVRTSGAEFSVAQQMYVETRGGWFSDRSVRYLASGKPVLVEDTGFSRTYPTGEGLLSFSSIDEATDGVSRIRSNYAAHARAAREIAETYFDSDRVLSQLVDQVGICP